MGLVSSIIKLVPVLFLVAIIKKYSVYKQKKAPYPPGPPPKPFVGNAFDFPRIDAAFEFQKWGKKYGSNIVHATALGRHIVVLNRFEDAEELLEKRATNYSDRPIIPIVDLMGWDYYTVFLNYGNEWRAHRRISQEYLGPPAMKTTHSVIAEKVYNFLQDLLFSPENLFYHVKMLSISIPMKTMYGYDVKSIYDPFIVKAERSDFEALKLVVPGGSLINEMPFLRHVPPWFPGASSRKMAADIKKLVYEMQDMSTKFVEKRVAEGTAFPSLLSDFIEKKNASGATDQEEKDVKNVALTVYGGTSDSTSSSINTFLYLMVSHPEIQRKAQEELDRILGSTCLPDFKDRISLPYIEAIYREVLRWGPPGHLAIPRAVVDDDYYEGYLIPKGAIIYPNIWAMTHNETVYPQPFVFNPERFMDPNGKLNGDDRVIAYGFGRRICAGKHVASATLWYAMACTLACFSIGKAKDEDGNDIELNDQYDSTGLIIHKAPFKCSITPRSAAWRKLLEDLKTDD